MCLHTYHIAENGMSGPHLHEFVKEIPYRSRMAVFVMNCLEKGE